MNTWPAQDAKARFNELLEASLSQGPQIVTKHGKAAAVLVPIRQWETLQGTATRSLKQLLAPQAPLLPAVPTRGRRKLRQV